MSESGNGARQAPRRSDGERTHREILDVAMRLASVEGLGSLTIGRLSREVGISKSGVFAHFRSKERLQKETVEAARDVFLREVLEPGLAAPQGLSRVEALCEAYLSYVEREVFPGGCFFAHILAEFDARDGPIHEEVAADQRGWIGLLEEEIRAAQRGGELDPERDPAQLAFQLTAAAELANYYATLHRDGAMVERGREAVRQTLAEAGHRADPSRRTE